MRHLFVFLLALALLVPGCAEEKDKGGTPTPTEGDNNETPQPEAPTPETAAVGLAGIYPATIAYDPERIEVVAGSNVTITFTNNDGNPLVDHNWVLEGVDGAATAVISNGETADATFLAPQPGQYAFYCSVGSHRDQGMEGTFVVT